MVIQVGLKGRDNLLLDYTLNAGVLGAVSLRAIGCYALLLRAQELRGLLRGSLSEIPVPEGADHASLLARELVLRLKGEWAFPYHESELCHCRAVATAKVDDSIIAGAHDVDAIAEQTSAGSACGSCRPDSQRIINYRLGKDTPVSVATGATPQKKSA